MLENQNKSNIFIKEFCRSPHFLRSDWQKNTYSCKDWNFLRQLIIKLTVMNVQRLPPIDLSHFQLFRNLSGGVRAQRTSSGRSFCLGNSDAFR